MSSAEIKRLSRETYDAAAPAPVRLIHIGLGAFHRAHQVFYTVKSEKDPANPQWGYCSFTGHSIGISAELQAQDGLFTLVTRSAEGDTPEVIEGIVEAQVSENIDRLRELIADPGVAVVTLTITEAGYHLTEDLEIDTDDEDVRFDIAALKNEDAEELQTAAGKLVYGLRARRSAGHPGIAIMSCDNIANNGETTRASVLGLAAEVDTALTEWITENVTFPSSSIDRITPATTDELIADVEKATGYHDDVPVVTEPFISWVIEGEFPAGRPSWENVGVQFVDDIEQFENRKLWLLNGSHSLMAYYGQLRGHETVAEAIGDAEVRQRVEALWDEAANHLSDPDLDIPGYRDALIERFENPRIRHNLAQIAIDGATKQRMRAVAICRAERIAGRNGSAAAFSIAGWVAYVLARGEEGVQDTRAREIESARTASDPIPALIAVLDETLAQDSVVVDEVREIVQNLSPNHHE